MTNSALLLIGEVCIDFTLSTAKSPVKMRLGGVVHAARGLWACGAEYAVAACCPGYLVEETRKYLEAHGCTDFFVIAITDGAPNVILINDVREVGDQGYEDLLRDARKSVEAPDIKRLAMFERVVIFPGSYSLDRVAEHLAPDCQVTIDIAYDVETVEQLGSISSRITDIVISTSSNLFLSAGSKDLGQLTSMLQGSARRLLLKENRGGSRLIDLNKSTHAEISATLGETKNSVGVGDVFTAVYARFLEQGPMAAAWRGAQAATRYAQTTYPDDLKRDIQRDLALSVEDVEGLGGVFLPWHDRPQFEIYLAAPDFSYVDRREIESAVAALKYHNFRVRRPVVENGEAELSSHRSNLEEFYVNDLKLLDNCALVFAIPQHRDPGTLVEVGYAIATGKPVITFDPQDENNNTMVICGSACYSGDLDECLNATFEAISKLRRKSICPR